MKKPVIIHCIQSLGRGGAETMLVRAIKGLPEYFHVVVTLFNDDRLGNELQCDKYICMYLNAVRELPLAIKKLKNIIKVEHADIVHTHLLWPTVVARLATPSRIPLITTIHTSIGSAPDYKKWFIKAIDKFTYKFRKSIIIGVSEIALKDYFSFLKIRPYQTYLIYTFVDFDRFSKTASAYQPGETFRMISTGSFRDAKNFPFLINAFEGLKNENIILDIYGSGPLAGSFQKMIDDKGVNVRLMGEVTNLEQVLPLYHAFTMSSKYEGFSLAVLEAMAAKLPLLLSDIASFREQGGDTALYFNLNNEADFIEKVQRLKTNIHESVDMADRAYQKAQNNYTVGHHISLLQEVYRNAIKK